MVIGIDASNIRTGGGVVHLQGILSHVPFQECEISQIVIWGESKTLQQLPEHERIFKIALSELEGSLFKRFSWQLNKLGNEALRLGCDVLFVPGGIYLGKFRPLVSMVQNMQVFEWPELRREGFSKEGVRLLLLLIFQGVTSLRSNGLIFLPHYCQKYFHENWKWLIKNVKSAVIPHGVNHPDHKKNHKSIDEYSNDNPLRILYVSTVKNYKHQWNLINAVAKLCMQGYPLHLDLVGGGDKSAIERMQKAAAQYQRAFNFVSYHGDQPYERTLQFFEKADIFAFPSSCETFGISLLEAMSYGLPIACSNYGPLPEVLGEAGVFFDPLDPDSIAEILKKLVLDISLRIQISAAARERSELFSWQTSSWDTFRLLTEVAKRT